MYEMENEKKQKAMEPLFMAISGFIGMTIMFILSVLILPKFHKLKPKGFQEDSQLTNITRIVFQAFEGMDCSERFACETGKAVKAFHLHNNRFIRFLRNISPESLFRKLKKIEKYTDVKYKCASIVCKNNEQTLKNSTAQSKMDNVKRKKVDRKQKLVY